MQPCIASLRRGLFLCNTDQWGVIGVNHSRSSDDERKTDDKDSSSCGRGIRVLQRAGPEVNSGSDGHDGAFNPTANTVINMADHADGIYHYTSVNVRTNVTVTFIPNANNTPVVWLVQSNCVINGIVDVSGKGRSLERYGGLGGPGGYAGGSIRGNVATAGAGPGGGPAGSIGVSGGGNASYGSLGLPFTGTQPGPIYGNSYILPLIGGSGGGGGAAWSYSSYNFGGGGGGGAILIAAPNQIEVNGSIQAIGGLGNGSGGGAGSGGAVRLVTYSIIGSGQIYAYDVRNEGGIGRVRFDAVQVHFATIYGSFTQGFQPIIIPGAGAGAQLSISSIAGASVGAGAKGLLTTPDVVISSQAVNPVPVMVHCSNIPLNMTVTVFAVPAMGAGVQASGLNSAGTVASSTATISLNLPHGGGLIYAQAVTAIGSKGGASINSAAKTASYAQTGLTTGGETFAKMEVTAVLGGPSQITYITDSGKRFSAPSN